MAQASPPHETKVERMIVHAMWDRIRIPVTERCRSLFHSEGETNWYDLHRTVKGDLKLLVQRRMWEDINV